MAAFEKIYLLMHVTYGDFDVYRESPVLASSNKTVLDEEASLRNEKRTAQQVKDCEKFIVTKKTIKLI